MTQPLALTAPPAAVSTARTTIRASSEVASRALVEAAALGARFTDLRARVLANFRDLSSGDVASALTDHTKFLVMNAEFCRVLGCAPGTSDGQPWSYFVHPDDFAACLRGFEAARAGPTSWRCRLRGPSGGYTEFDWSAGPPTRSGLFVLKVTPVT